MVRIKGAIPIGQMRTFGRGLACQNLTQYLQNFSVSDSLWRRLLYLVKVQCHFAFLLAFFAYVSVYYRF